MTRLNDAIDCFREATAFHRAGALEQAGAIYRDLLREDPNHSGAWHRLGLILHSQHQLPAAVEHIERALSLCDTKAVYWNNYGVVLRTLGDGNRAEAAFRQATVLRDDYADAWSNLGLIQAERGELEEAETALRRALGLQPQHADAIRHMAVIHRERGEYQKALRACREAADVEPARTETYCVEGSILSAMGRLGEAASAYERARCCGPNEADAQLSLGIAYVELGETEKARAVLHRAADLRPDLPVWRLRELTLCPVHFQTAAELRDFRASLERQLDQASIAPDSFDWRNALRDGFVPSFQLSHHGVCNRQLREKFAHLFASHFPQERRKPRRDGKIRIGFSCTQSHEGGFVRGFGGVMKRLDRSRHEVLGLVSRSALSFCQERVGSSDVTWISLPHNLERALEVFRQADCDVVVHWHAGTDIVNYFLPFLPLAPIQCIGFGTHGTTGIENVDYFVSSRLFERGTDADDDYTESLVQFDGATSWQPRPPEPEPATRSDFGLPSAGTLYFCPQRQAKFHPDFDVIVRRVLETDSCGHIVVLQGRQPRPAETLRARLAKTLGESLLRRILFVPTQATSQYYRLMSVMDVVLDTPAYSASLTGYDALSLGLPIVTLPGRLMVQRYAYGLYAQMGLEGLTAASEDEYVELAVRLGAEVDFRKSVSDAILERCSVLYENPSVVDEFEEFFAQVTERAGG